MQQGLSRHREQPQPQSAGAACLPRQHGITAVSGMLKLAKCAVIREENGSRVQPLRMPTRPVLRTAHPQPPACIWSDRHGRSYGAKRGRRKETLSGTGTVAPRPVPLRPAPRGPAAGAEELCPALPHGGAAGETWLCPRGWEVTVSPRVVAVSLRARGMVAVRASCKVTRQSAVMATRNCRSWGDIPGVAAEGHMMENMLQIKKVTGISFKEQNPGNVLLGRNAKTGKTRKRVPQREQQCTQVLSTVIHSQWCCISRLAFGWSQACW